MGFIKETLTKQADFIKIVSSANNVRRIHLWWNALYCCIRYGATPSDWYCYEMWRYGHSHLKNVITRRKNLEIDRIFNPREYKDTFDNKLRFNETYSKFVKRKWVHFPSTDFDTIRQMKWNGCIVVKPLNLSSGRGIFMFDPSRESWDDLRNKVSGHEYLFEERVELHPDLARLNPPSCNTVRFYTMIDRIGNVRILDVVLRVGGGDSIQDNFHAKGVVYPIDINTGLIKGAGRDLANNEYLEHPSTGIYMPGVQIPCWREAVKFVNEVAAFNPKARFIGWDVAITPEGCDMIEGNYYVYCGLMQIFDKCGKYSLIKSYQ